MKENIKKTIVVCISTLLLASCGSQKKDEVNSSLIKETTETQGEKVENKSILKTGKESFIVYSKNKLDSNEITLEYAYYSLVDDGKCDAAYKDSINQLVADFIYAVSDMGEERKRPIFSMEMFDESLPLFNSYYQEMIKDEIASTQPPWLLRSNISISEGDSTVLVITRSYSYTGGAHGNEFVIYTIISKNDGGELKLNDFIQDVSSLNLLASSILRKDRNIDKNQNLADAGFWIDDESNFLNDNFYFENGDLVFLFNQYEIASYADGQIEIRIPQNGLKRFLK